MAKRTDGPDVAGERYVQALFEFGYDAHHPRLERGEVIELGGHQNDQTLMTLRYMAEVPPGTPLKVCGTCGKAFINDECRTEHGDTWHAYECGCGWVSPPGTPSARARELAAHREKCDLVREKREDARQAHRNEVRDIKAQQPIVVAT